MGRPSNYYRGTPILSFPPPVNIVSWLHTEDTISKVDSFHHRFIMLINLHGACDAVIDHRVYNLREGEGVLVFPFQYHHFVPGEGKRLWLFIGFETNDIIPFEHMKGRPFALTDYFVTLSHSFMKLYADEITAHSEEGVPNCDRTVLALSSMLAEALKSVRESTRVESRSRLSESLSAKVQRWLYQNVGRGVRIADAAHHFALSESRLRARFRSEMGRSLGTVLAMLRFEKARSLLTSTDLRIGEIASTSGFENVYAFSTAFKQRYGISPRKFRQQRH
ncbi:MAG: helix-turn-helix transcriptional regulator [Fibrobacteres bacterium]|nr:helix-turn-helix transcriptional regulator [Fibrobacterota bacterium]